MVERAVIYPIKNGNKKDSNFELMMSLRSIENNLAEDVPIFVISEERPKIISSRVNYLQCDGYVDAIQKACSVADEILWMNDDIFLLHHHCWEDFRRWVVESSKVPQHRIDEMKSSANGWRSKKGQILQLLKDEGKSTMDFSTHTPYLYETVKLKEIVSKFNFGYKTAFETAYGNYWEVDIRECKKLQRYHTRPLPVDCSYYEILNYNDIGATSHIRGFLLGMFPKPSKYEYHKGENLTTLLSL